MELEAIAPIAVSALIVLITVVMFVRSKSTKQDSAAPPAAPVKAAVEEPPVRGHIKIMWGSQTGTAEDFSKRLMREAKDRQFAASSVDLEDYEPAEELAEETELLVFLMSTHGEGEPTDNAIGFYKWMNLPEHPPDLLKGVKYTCFALGNTQYEHYCFMGRWLDRRMKELGATAVFERGEGDDDKALEDDFDEWKLRMWKHVAGDDGAVHAPSLTLQAEWMPKAIKEVPLESWLAKLYPKNGCQLCTVLENRELQAANSSDSTRHVEVKAVTGQLQYLTADDLGVYAANPEELVKKVASCLGKSMLASFHLSNMDVSDRSSLLPTPCSVGRALAWYCDLSGAPPKELLLAMSQHASDSGEQKQLEELGSMEGKQHFHDTVHEPMLSVADLLFKFPSVEMPFEYFMQLVPRLQPRYYTISSSNALHPAHVHLTVKQLKDDAGGRCKLGVCSTHIAEASPQAALHTFVRTSGFRLPADASLPVVMVGPGTGIAPFRAFLQELGCRKQQGQAVPHTCLYFGCQQPDKDFLYEAELQDWQQQGVLAELRTAFSRQSKHKVYVQQRMAEDGAKLWTMLQQQGGHVYICGATSMGRDVVNVLAEVAQKHGGLAGEKGTAWVKSLESQGRLVKELWS